MRCVWQSRAIFYSSIAAHILGCKGILWCGGNHIQKFQIPETESVSLYLQNPSSVTSLEGLNLLFV